MLHYTILQDDKYQIINTAITINTYIIFIISSYTKKVIADAGATRTKLGIIPLKNPPRPSFLNKLLPKKEWKYESKPPNLFQTIPKICIFWCPCSFLVSYIDDIISLLKTAFNNLLMVKEVNEERLA